MAERGVGSWTEYQRMVLGELERLDHDIGKLQESVTKLREEVSALNVKAGVWGLVGGGLVAGVAFAVRALS